MSERGPVATVTRPSGEVSMVDGVCAIGQDLVNLGALFNALKDEHATGGFLGDIMPRPPKGYEGLALDEEREELVTIQFSGEGFILARPRAGFLSFWSKAGVEFLAIRYEAHYPRGYIHAPGGIAGNLVGRQGSTIAKLSHATGLYLRVIEQGDITMS